MAQIYTSVAQLIGGTPLMELCRIEEKRLDLPIHLFERAEGEAHHHDEANVYQKQLQFSLEGESFLFETDDRPHDDPQNTDGDHHGRVGDLYHSSP